MDMHESYNKLVIAWAILVPHVGYWHGSDVEPEGLCGPRALRNYRANNLHVALEPVQ